MKNIPPFISVLKQQLEKELPGYKAQEKMEPSTRKRFLVELKHQEPQRESAVLILLFPENNDFSFALIERQTYKGVHSGQISLPGGQVEKTDNSLQTTALRETEEEIGIPYSDVNIIGELSSLYIPPSNFNVKPFVGFIDYKPLFNPNFHEVKRIISVPLQELLHPDTATTKTICIHTGEQIDVPCFYPQQAIVWGATAMILNEFKIVASNL